MPKRGENIYKRKDKRWEGRYKTGYKDDGTAKYSSVYASTYNECKQKLSSAKNLVLMQQKTIKLNMTVKEMFEGWLVNVSVRVKKSTIDTYTNIYQKHILPSMGNYQVQFITVEFIDKFIFEQLNYGRVDGKGGLSPKMVLNVISVLKAVFRYAEKVYGIKNPTRYISLPKSTSKKIKVLSDHEIEKIRIYLSENRDYFELIYDLCIQTGIRIGELCALKCEDIDLENGILKVNKTVQRIKVSDLSCKYKTKVVIDSPKSDKSNREIPLPDNLLKKLEQHIHYKNKSDFVFTPDGKKNFDTRTIQKKFKKVLNACNIGDFKFHIIRHTFATKWTQANYDIKSLSEILGHTNINITLSLYVHSSIECKRKQINLLFDF